MNIQPKAGTGGKILIAYASQFGTTGEVAEVISEELSNGGNVTETKHVNDIANLKGYDAVIIGSAIQYDKWMPEATAFVRRNQDELCAMPVAFFFTCLTLSRQNEKTNRQAQSYANKLSTLFPRVKPISIGGFAGAVDYTKFPVLPRLVVRAVFAFLGVKNGDYRDWSIIKSWAENLNPKLTT